MAEFFCDTCQDDEARCYPAVCPGAIMADPQEADRASVSPEQDQQEASSIRYRVDLEVALLTSGNWALYHGGGPVGTQLIEIWPEFPGDRIRSLAEIERTRKVRVDAEYEERGRRLRAQDAGRAPPTARKTAEEMDL